MCYEVWPLFSDFRKMGLSDRLLRWGPESSRVKYSIRPSFVKGLAMSLGDRTRTHAELAEFTPSQGKPFQILQPRILRTVRYLL